MLVIKIIVILAILLVAARESTLNLAFWKAMIVRNGVNMPAKDLAKYSLVELSIPEIMEQNTIPVLFAHGSADSLVPLWMTQRAIDACKAPKEVLITEGAEHGTGFIVDHDKYVTLLSDFLIKVREHRYQV